MTKMEILALKGLRATVKSYKEEPKPDWMSDEHYRGKCEAYTHFEMWLEDLLDAAKEANSAK